MDPLAGHSKSNVPARTCRDPQVHPCRDTACRARPVEVCRQHQTSQLQRAQSEETRFTSLHALRTEFHSVRNRTRHLRRAPAHFHDEMLQNRSAWQEGYAAFTVRRPNVDAVRNLRAPSRQAGCTRTRDSCSWSGGDSVSLSRRRLHDPCWPRPGYPLMPFPLLCK